MDIYFYYIKYLFLSDLYNFCYFIALQINKFSDLDLAFTN